MTRLSLPPLGELDVDLEAPLHRGALYDLWSARHAGQPVVCKTPRLASSSEAPGGVFVGTAFGVGTSLWQGSAGCLDPSEDPGGGLGIPDTLLLLEAEQIRRTRGAWNHHVEATGVWDLGWYLGQSTQRRVVMVYPRLPGVPLASLPRAKQRELLPAMMPALVRALSAARHGDLTADNLIIDEESGRFSLIDPGVGWWSLRPASPRGRDLPDDSTSRGVDDRLIFATTARAYPILPPQYDPPREPVMVPPPQDLRGHLAVMGEGWFRGPAIERAWFQPGAAGALPSAADLLAVGVLYFEALTGQHPFPWLEERPLWVGSFGETRSDGWLREGAARLSREGVPSPGALAEVTPSEEALCTALLGLTLRQP